MHSEIAKGAIAAATGYGVRHWRIWEWANGLLLRKMEPRNVLVPTSLQELWRWAATNVIFDGQFLELEKKASWYCTEWVPRLPGQIWVEANLVGKRLIDIPLPDICRALSGRNAMNDLVHLMMMEYSHWEARYFDPSRVGQSLFDQGISVRSGIFRPALQHGSDRFALLSLVTENEFFIDAGFPVIVSEPVYRKIKSAQRHAMAVEIEGVVRLRELNPSTAFRTFLDALGANATDELRRAFDRPVGVRSLVGEIVSPIDINVTPHNAHPTGTIRVDGHDGNKLYERDGLISIARYVVQNPTTIPNSIDKADFLLGEDHQFGTALVPVTDFDARLARFASAAPIARNPARDQAVIQDIADHTLS